MVFSLKFALLKINNKNTNKNSMFEGKKRKKVKLKGKTQILKQKQTTFFLLKLQTCCTAVTRTTVQQVCSIDFKGKRTGKGFPKIYKGLDGLLFFVLFLFSLLYNYIKVNFTGNILFVFF